MLPLRPLLVDRLLLPAAIVGALYAVLQLLAALLLDVALAPAAVPADLAAHVLLAVALRGLTRSNRALALLLLPPMLLLHVGNALKIALLGAPLRPDDLNSAHALLLILDGGWLLLAGALGLGTLAAVAVALRFERRAAAAGLALLAVPVAVLAFAPAPLVHQMDRVFGHSTWDQPGNYSSRGPLIYWLQEGARHLAHRESAPSAERVLATYRVLEHARLRHRPTAGARPAAHIATAPPRNVHMIVLESFWDPTALRGVAWSQDPFVPAFRRLWTRAGNSHALVPVFGGHTANSEFEALCGLPVHRDDVVFESRLNNPLPCLPAVLRGAGYATVASHPNVPAFWNRHNAYPRIGFDAFLSGRHFAADDMNGSYLGDASLYRQVLERLEPLLADGVPVFNYILTFFGHLDYPLNAARPQVISAPGADERLLAYANTVYYKTRELMDFLAVLRERDPDALVVVLGDHLPSLGPNFAAYTDSGVLARSFSAFTDRMFRDMVATPLVVIDGTAGPLAPGDLALYQLPQLLTEALGVEHDAPFALSATPPGLAIRPLPGLHVVQSADGRTVACRDGAELSDELAELCHGSAGWLDQLDTLEADLLFGQQHALRPRRAEVPRI